MASFDHDNQALNFRTSTSTFSHNWSNSYEPGAYRLNCGDVFSSINTKPYPASRTTALSLAHTYLGLVPRNNYCSGFSPTKTKSPTLVTTKVLTPRHYNLLYELIR